MRRVVFGAAAILGAVSVAGACPASAQSRYGADQRDDRSGAYGDDAGDHGGHDHQGAYGREGDHQGRGGRDSDRQAFDQRETTRGGFEGDRGGREDHDSDRHDHDRRDAHDDGFRRHGVRHFCWYESGWHGRGSYACGYAWRSRHGWAGANEGDYEYRGHHYRGYWEDGTGRRFYDQGGFGVGHCDYGGPRPWSC